jgi:hypothetical protein
MREKILVTRREHKTSAQLKWILAELLLTCPSRFCTLSRRVVVGSKQVQQIRRAQTRHLIGAPIFVNQQGESDARFLAKHAGVVAIAQADRGKRRALRMEFAFVCAQLRDVLAAENSTVMAQEDNDSGLIRPQRTEPDLSAIALRQRKLR